MGRSRGLESAGMLIAAAALFTSCGPRGTSQQGSGESIATTTPPSVETPGRAQQGVVGKAASVGEWTLLVREVEFDDEPGEASTTLKIEVGLSHDAERPLRVRRDDWRLADGDDTPRLPHPADPEKSGVAMVEPGESEDLELEFAVVDVAGPYILMFEPVEGGPGVLEVPLP